MVSGVRPIKTGTASLICYCVRGLAHSMPWASKTVDENCKSSKYKDEPVVAATRVIVYSLPSAPLGRVMPVGRESGGRDGINETAPGLLLLMNGISDVAN